VTLHIADGRMDSDVTTHVAHRLPVREDPAPGAWMVSWCPLETWNRDQAVTAMTLAETLANPEAQPGHRLWPHVKGWSAELGMTLEQVVAALRPNN
jgi:hypothetical protein